MASIPKRAGFASRPPLFVARQLNSVKAATAPVITKTHHDRRRTFKLAHGLLGFIDQIGAIVGTKAAFDGVQNSFVIAEKKGHWGPPKCWVGKRRTRFIYGVPPVILQDIVVLG